MRMSDQLKAILPVYIPRLTVLLDRLDVALAGISTGQSGMEVSWSLDHEVQELISTSKRVKIYFANEVGGHFINFLVGLRSVPVIAPGHLAHARGYLDLLRDYVAACASTLDFDDSDYTRKFHLLMLREREEIARLSRERAAS